MRPDRSRPRALFVLKKRDFPYVNEVPGAAYGYGSTRSSGLHNSASMVVAAMVQAGYHAEIVEVPDNNAIDREATRFQPTHCVVEAFWVVPEKFDVLRKLHPTVKWIIRNHSEMPFLANEGIAMGWTLDYLAKGVALSSNSRRATAEIRALAGATMPATPSQITRMTPYLPNIYAFPAKPPVRPASGAEIGGPLRIGCFGAMRPLKNHLPQAIAALACASQLGRTLEFHVNASRIEMKGDQILKNLRNLFDRARPHRLVEHGWLDHDSFLGLCAQMDIGMQVSLSETYNIVAADLVSAGTPVVASNEVAWLDPACFCDPTDHDSIVAALHRMLDPSHQEFDASRSNLVGQNRQARQIWDDFLLYDRIH